MLYFVDEHGPNIIPADGQVDPIIKGESPEQHVYFDGDASDLFGNGRNEIRLYKRSLNKKKEQEIMDISIRNIRIENGDAFFDVIFSSDQK